MDKTIKKDYILASFGLLGSCVGLILVRIAFGLGWFKNLPEVFQDFLGSFLIQVVLIFGVSFLVMWLQERDKLKKPVLEPHVLEDNETTSAGSDQTEREKSVWKRIKSRLVEMGFRKPPAYMWILSILIGVLFYILTMGISYFNTILLFLLGVNLPAANPTPPSSIGVFLVALFSGAVLPGIFEEFLHRGVILKGLRDTRKDTQAIIISALLFSLMHAYIFQTAYTFVGGIIFAVLAIKTRSIYPSIIVHFMNNGLATYIDYMRANQWPGYQWYDNFISSIADNFATAFVVWLLCAALLIAILIVISSLEKLKRKRELKKSNKPIYDESGRPILRPVPQISERMPLFKPALADSYIMHTATFLIAIATIFSFILNTY